MRIPATLRDGTESDGPQIRAGVVSSYSEKMNGGTQVTSDRAHGYPCTFPWGKTRISLSVVN